jgi:hypothetical protein
MKHNRQITKGIISKIEPKELYLMVTAETDHEGMHYSTNLSGVVLPSPGQFSKVRLVSIRNDHSVCGRIPYILVLLCI